MRYNKYKLSADECFERDIIRGMGLYYRRELSRRAKMAWRKRKHLSTSVKVAM